MRSIVAVLCVSAAMIATAPAVAGSCPDNPHALGTSRTIVVDPYEHNRLGSFQYAESLPLTDKEVVITFDDGPLPPYTTRILDILAQECVKATFFMVGKMARVFPKVVRRIHEEGHTLANHSQTHPYDFHTMSVLDAAAEIESGFDSIAAAVGDPAKVSPFFRFPGLHRQDAVERYLAARGRMSWSVDFMGDDWTRISAHEIVRRVLDRLETKGKGILMLHDIKPATALGFPELINQLKARGYRVVHVVHATPDRPKTVTAAADWRVRNPPTHEQLTNREPSLWPKATPFRVQVPETPLEAPSLTSFGAGSPETAEPVSLVTPPEIATNGTSNGEPPVAWPNEVLIGALPDTDILPVPALDTFRYTSRTRKSKKDKKKDKDRPTWSAGSSVATSDTTGSVNGNKARGSEPKSSQSGHTWHAGQSWQSKSWQAKSGQTKSWQSKSDQTKSWQSKSWQSKSSQKSWQAQSPNSGKSWQAKSGNTGKSSNSGKSWNAGKPSPKRQTGHQIQLPQPRASLDAQDQAVR